MTTDPVNNPAALPTPAADGGGKGGLLDGVISKDALKAIESKVKEVSKKVSDAIHGKGEIEKKYIDIRIDKTVEILLADLDGADGAFDHKISKAQLQKRANKLADAFADSKKGAFAEALGTIKQGIAQKLAETTGETLDTQELYTNITKAAHVKTDAIFNKFDLDHNGKIDQKELKEALQKVQEASAGQKGNAEACDGTCEMPKAPDVRPKLPRQK